MQQEIQPFVSKIRELIEEIRTYLRYKDEQLKRINLIEHDYQKGRFGYLRYKQLIEKALAKKTKKEWVEYYDSYIYSLLKRIDYSNSQLFDVIFREHSAVEQYRIIEEKRSVPEARAHSPVSDQKYSASHPKHALPTPKHAALRPKRHPVSASSVAAGSRVQDLKGYDEKSDVKPLDIRRDAKKMPRPADLIAQEVSYVPKDSRFAPPNLPEELAVDIRADDLSSEPQKKPAPAVPGMSRFRKEVSTQRYTLGQRIKYAFSPRKKKPAFDRIMEEDHPVKKKPVRFKAPGIIDLVKNMIDRFRQDKEVILADRTIITSSVLELAQMEREELKALKASKIDVEELAHEAKRIRRIAAIKKAVKVYRPSLIGTVANVTMRPLSLSLMARFPGFFKDFYTKLRLANIRLLSNTYINVMFLFVFVSLAFSLPVWTIYFFFKQFPLYLIILRGILMAVLTSGTVLFGFYYYPISKASTRTRSINTNLPFAIDHLSAVASSGVNPTAMFRLIAVSREYGEICVEMQKIVDFIDLFGYDLITAIKSVSSTTPSPRFKEFLEGMISTIETGGDLKNFLSQKSSESMLAYRLERKRYVETISTYSDIYTGILIAAPLFFMAALSLVSVLGGTIGGIDVDVLVAFGTYIVIPLLNVLFIIFLETNQPQV